MQARVDEGPLRREPQASQTAAPPLSAAVPEGEPEAQLRPPRGRSRARRRAAHRAARPRPVERLFWSTAALPVVSNQESAGPGVEALVGKLVLHDKEG